LIFFFSNIKYIMGNTAPSVSAASKQEYELAMKKYEEDCAAMEAEEEASRVRLAPRPPELALYFCIQASALCCEVPCRTAWHGSCAASHGCCCIPFSYLFDFVDATLCLCEIGLLKVVGQSLQWHVNQTIDYVQLSRLMARNLWNPCSPHYVYAADVSLSRPPKPISPYSISRGGGGLCDLLNCACNCAAACNSFGNWCEMEAERMESLHNRELRSKLCLLSLCNNFECMESFHLATCLGPWPCLGETPEERRFRWHLDYSVKKEQRTNEFWRIRACQTDRYSFCRSESGSVSAAIVESLDEGALADDLLPWARGMVGAMIGLGCAASCIGISSLLVSLNAAGAAASGGAGSSSGVSSLLYWLSQPAGGGLKLACCTSALGCASGLYGVGGECKGPDCLPCCLRGGGARQVHGVEYEPFAELELPESGRTTSFGISPETMVIVRPQTILGEKQNQNYGSVSPMS
jgi:hypothetical protein